jgi:3-oxoacyl-[acyl-carrier protein] reductase
MKTVVVTGASAGIGRAVAVELGRRGWRVALVARRKEELEKTKLMVEVAGGQAEVMVCDLANKDEINSLVVRIDGWVGQVNALVNIAGVWHGKDEVYAGRELQSFTQETVCDTLTVGLIAPILLAKGLLLKMKKGDCIVNLSGTFENGGSGWIPYFASKRGLEDFSMGLSEELMERGVRVNCVSPSDTSTEEYQKYFPEDAVNANTVGDVAEVVVKMIESDITGQVWVVKRGVVNEDGYHK